MPVKSLFFFDVFFALLWNCIGDDDDFGDMHFSIWFDAFLASSSTNRIEKTRVPKITFFDFCGALFCLLFCRFFKKIMNCICYGQFLAAQGVMSIGVFLRPPVLIWFDKTLRTHTQKNRIFKISLIPRRKSLREIPQILHFLKIRHRQENSVWALRLLILKIASN